MAAIRVITKLPPDMTGFLIIMGFRHIMADADSRIHNQLVLKRGQSATTKQESTERTSKTLKVRLRFRFQAAIISLSFLA